MDVPHFKLFTYLWTTRIFSFIYIYDFPGRETTNVFNFPSYKREFRNSSAVYKAFDRINRIDMILKRSSYKIQLIKKFITIRHTSGGFILSKIVKLL